MATGVETGVPFSAMDEEQLVNHEKQNFNQISFGNSPQGGYWIVLNKRHASGLTDCLTTNRRR